ncbi:glycogen synthase GlgA [Tianweitania sp.]|uniref:glycogen synthase GlgA n=1 Tax=Tianweitania sp. TaxID=2021634 RepID=UPI00289CAFBE|nr:glycogen synthase GlgA [Tianweitania sp.]
MQVLAVASEIYPLVKTGGLADVAGALPLALERHGVGTTTLIPGYKQVMARVHASGTARSVFAWGDFYGGSAEIIQAEVAGLKLFVLNAPHLFERDGGIYGNGAVDWGDNWRRFAALSRAGADIAGGLLSDYRPDLVHVHDWQAALTLAYMRYGAAVATPSVITIHNLAFQGQYDAGIFAELGLPDDAMSIHGVEYYGGVGYLKAGLQSAWAITTVSPSYAQEIRTPEFGMGLDGLLNDRSASLVGIVNGIDIDQWNPQTDPHLPAHYSADVLDDRQSNRHHVEERFGLDRDDSLLLCLVSRLTWQKGIDVLVDCLDDIVGMGAKVALLGNGDARFEGEIHAAAGRHPGRIGVVTGYDEALSHQLTAGADAILVPSRFEPCGLTQLHGLRYGCVPIVTRTGGLADTIIDANEAALTAKVATGFQFEPLARQPFLNAIRRALNVHREPDNWRQMQVQAMKSDVSWDHSAECYIDVYRSLLRGTHL